MGKNNKNFLEKTMENNSFVALRKKLAKNAEISKKTKAIKNLSANPKNIIETNLKNIDPSSKIDDREEAREVFAKNRTTTDVRDERLAKLSAQFLAKPTSDFKELFVFSKQFNQVQRDHFAFDEAAKQTQLRVFKNREYSDDALTQVLGDTKNAALRGLWSDNFDKNAVHALFALAYLSCTSNDDSLFAPKRIYFSPGSSDPEIERKLQKNYDEVASFQISSQAKALRVAVVADPGICSLAVLESLLTKETAAHLGISLLNQEYCRKQLRSQTKNAARRRIVPRERHPRKHHSDFGRSFPTSELLSSDVHAEKQSRRKTERSTFHRNEDQGSNSG
jgi:hypothetical protein